MEAMPRPPGGDAGSAGAEDANGVPARPWTLAAAMEPVPPLAPPPARPGHGVSLVTATRQAGEPSRSPSLVVVALLLAAVALITVVVLVVLR
jgi:hypothetical protein